MSEKNPTYRKQGNRANLRPAHDSQEVKERLAKDERKKLTELFKFMEQFRIKETTEKESFVELLNRQNAQGKRLDALQAEYSRVLSSLTIVSEQLISLELDLARDRAKSKAKLDVLQEAIRRINDVLNVRLAAGLQGIDSPKRGRMARK